MTVRAKPWTLENNSNTSSCDGTNSSVSGWSGGSTESFIQQLIDECGVLCEGNPDIDDDGIITSEDNCPSVPNTDQNDIDADVNGDDSKVAFNSKFLQDVVGVLDTTQIKIDTSYPSSPGVFTEKSNGDSNYRHVIMPMFVQW